MKANIPKGPSMNEMLRQAQKMQEDMQNKQVELEAREYDVSAGGGAVKIKINGKKEIIGMEIDPMIVDPDDIETMTDIIIAAVNEAVRTVEDTASKEMERITGAMGGLGGGIPGLF